jgi:coproporphyrinogen III oxidase-like Fe-S oxidoreductase
MLEADGLVDIDQSRLAVTSTGRLLLRAVAMTFDACIPPSALAGVPYSRAV